MKTDSDEYTIPISKNSCLTECVFIYEKIINKDKSWLGAN